MSEKDAEIVELRKLLDKVGMERAGFQGQLMGAEQRLNEILEWAKKEQQIATDEIVVAKDPEKLERWHGRRFVLMDLIDRLTNEAPEPAAGTKK